MSGVRLLQVGGDDDGQRLDRWLKRNVPDMPYVLAQKLLRKGAIRVDGKRAEPSARLRAGQEIRIPPYEPAKDKAPGRRKLSEADAAFIRSLVIYQDDAVIALNKPHGLATQGGTNTKRHVDGMLEALADKKGVKPRLVHRLDKDTSGVLLLARSAEAARKLGKMFKSRDVKKIYWALVSPAPEVREGTIDAPLVKAGGPDKEKMTVDEDSGKTAVTEFVTIEHALDKAAFMAFWPRTGRTHQIRIHAQIMGCPVLGDSKYGGTGTLEGIRLARRLHLHAVRLICPHPVRGGRLDISAPLPPDLAESWKALGFSARLKGDPFEGLKV